ncbi:2-oxoglutarate dehydrogenase E1 component [Anaerobacillus alkaliphilus]|uniref:2-oxoglutarate dehydrogenase E1 component n=1 Tax=Anaerobacillus alkaliphilus TaxID=1548597 RepID=A0A4Q0VSX0_9BACI|nr:2-oxoglutarate dehydrogenase E1 component [Anaerobacillus alkaliphilus]RXJ00319.1 2-oxoglutarate dehydrogenase E1 component [Anaerobacillus alkaliphilus]
MGRLFDSNEDPWQSFSGPNLAYLMDVYDLFREDPNQVDEELRNLFEKWGPPITRNEEQATPTGSMSTSDLMKVVSATKLADHIRNFGHLYANLNPIKTDSKRQDLNLADFQLTRSDLEKLPANVICNVAPIYLENAYDAYLYLKDCYTKTLGFELSHVHKDDQNQWLTEQIEKGAMYHSLPEDRKKNLLKSLIEVEEFENFLQRTFVGQKRFSVEGLDTLIPMLQEVIRQSVEDGVKNVMIGMAHRGRLSVLAHVLNKPYEKIFAEFQQAPNKELVPSEGSTGINFGWTGDVKYHLGADLDIQKRAKVSLANNPSHLEFVAPIVQGYTRAVQDNRSTKGYPVQDTNSAYSIIIHGDAAFPGQGIVAETLNLSRLTGYSIGGSIHIIANNNIGFTTNSGDSRSTLYASDLAKGFEVPIIHVNADDPEACLSAILFAFEYRKKFKQDFIIDLIGYRRYGHNEMDEPATTQPQMYEFIRQHPTVKTLYKNSLIKDGIITEDFNQYEQEAKQRLQQSYETVKKLGVEKIASSERSGNVKFPFDHIETKVSKEILIDINEELLKWPDEFYVFPKLENILTRRKAAMGDEGKIDWGQAETLAFATILHDGTPIRLTGQDSERGTFAQRHVVLNDYKTGKKFSPLHQLSTSKASFAVHNSPLSEMAVVGFDYGYNVTAQESLVLWEAQYGDFANGAQVMFDQFIAAGRAKWSQKSGLVLLLPHGFEGQGPEHSSARLERFLQLAAENNWTVGNLTSSAQYFHMLRRQAATLGKEYVRPLVLMTPKSLLRHRLTASTAIELAEGKFNPIVEDTISSKPEAVKRLVLCSGKIAIDLQEAVMEQTENTDWLHIVRVEELYPFPKEKVKEVMLRFPALEEVVWVQEEPQNMGAWSYMNLKIRSVAPEHLKIKYVGRPYRSSPAEGDPTAHKVEQKRIIAETLKGGHQG